jgi:hypothetical protein
MRRTLATVLLLSSFVFTAAAYASDDVSASTPRVSTGVTPPQLLNSLNVTVPDPTTGHSMPADSSISVSFKVDETGQPRDIRILKGVDPFWNARVANAVQNLHYRPAMMDNQPVSMVVNLDVTLTR